MTPTDHTRITADDAAAIVALGASGAAEPVGAHGTGRRRHHLDGGPAPVHRRRRHLRRPAVGGRALSTVSTPSTKVLALGFVRAFGPRPGRRDALGAMAARSMPFDSAASADALLDETAESPMVAVYWAQDQGELVDSPAATIAGTSTPGSAW